MSEIKHKSDVASRWFLGNPICCSHQVAAKDQIKPSLSYWISLSVNESLGYKPDLKNEAISMIHPQPPSGAIGSSGWTKESSLSLWSLFSFFRFSFGAILSSVSGNFLFWFEKIYRVRNSNSEKKARLFFIDSSVIDLQLITFCEMASTSRCCFF